MNSSNLWFIQPQTLCRDWSEEISSTSDDSILSDSGSLSSKTLSSEDDETFPHLMVQPAESNSQTEPIITSEDESGNESTTPHVPQKRKSKGSNFQTFTLDDLPPSKWRERFQEFQAWLSLKSQRTEAQT